MQPTGRIEIHGLESLTLTDQQFLTNRKDGRIARIGAELRLPPGTERVPAVVLIHGSAGIGGNVDRWAREFNSMGMAAFLVDSFTGRGVSSTIPDQSLVGHLTMMVDAFRALERLANHSRISPGQIAVMGFSKGGTAALYSAMRRFHGYYGPGQIEFAAHLPFYTRCDIRYRDDEGLLNHPIRMFHGGSDDWIPAEGTRRYAERLRTAGKDVELTVYPGARHAFDNPVFPDELRFPDAQVSSRCRIEEREGGELVNLETGKPFRYDDPCVYRGATVGFHRRATEEALAAVKTFLTKLFQPASTA